MGSSDTLILGGLAIGVIYLIQNPSALDDILSKLNLPGVGGGNDTTAEDTTDEETDEEDEDDKDKKKKDKDSDKAFVSRNVQLKRIKGTYHPNTIPYLKIYKTNRVLTL